MISGVFALLLPPLSLTLALFLLSPHHFLAQGFHCCLCVIKAFREIIFDIFSSDKPLFSSVCQTRVLKHWPQHTLRMWMSNDVVVICFCPIIGHGGENGSSDKLLPKHDHRTFSCQRERREERERKEREHRFRISQGWFDERRKRLPFSFSRVGWISQCFFSSLCWNWPLPL